MSEQKNMDGWLRQAMSEKPLPALSAGFEERVTKRLRPPRRLTAMGRLVLGGYPVLALGLTIWLMRSHSIDWPLIAAACLVPVVLTAVTYGRRLHLA